MRARPRAGLTTLEVVVALLILLLGIHGVAGLQFVALRSAAQGRAHTRLGQLASAIADSLVLAGCSSVAGTRIEATGTVDWRIRLVGGTATIAVHVTPQLGRAWHTEHVARC